MQAMNSDTTFETFTTAPEATKRLGERLAKFLKGGELLELTSDLGGGKTTLVKGLAAGLGFDGSVPSPTFTVSRVYPVRDGLELNHFDFYRLGASQPPGKLGADIVSSELAEVLRDPKAITVIEWAEHGAARLPARRIRVHITPGAGDNDRKIRISGPERLIKGLKHDFSN